METGVIVGIDPVHVDLETASTILKELRHQFPGVTFVIVSGAQSVAFQYEPYVESSTTNTERETT